VAGLIRICLIAKKGSLARRSILRQEESHWRICSGVMLPPVRIVAIDWPLKAFTVGCQRCQASSACRLKNDTEILNGVEIKMLRGNHKVIQKSSKIVPLGAPLSLVISSQ
jgi:hypothetical protein